MRRFLPLMRDDGSSRSVGGGPVRRALTLALALVVVSQLLAGALVLAITLHRPALVPTWLVLCTLAAAWIHLAAGTVAWYRRPATFVGPLLCASGAAWIASAASLAPAEPWMAVGSIVALLPVALCAHVVLAFPTGRLPGVPDRLVVGAAYLVCLVLEAPRYLFDPRHPLHIASDPGVADAALWSQRVVALVTVVAASILLHRRLGAAPPQQRRALGPLWAYGVVAILWVPVGALVVRTLTDVPHTTVLGVQILLLCGVPVAFATAVVRGGFVPTAELAQLGAWLAGPHDRAALRNALADALGDPSVDLVFSVPGESSWVDRDGVAVDRPLVGAQRGAVTIDLAGDPVGAILYDTTRLDRPDEVAAAGRVVALALERERLEVALRASRARIVESADAERRRLARDLHDGLQVQLVLIALRAGLLGGTAGELRGEIEAAINHLRALVAGVVPAELAERGLPLAVEGLLDRAPVPVTLAVEGLHERLTPTVEGTGYMVVAEALTNVFKHARPTNVRVALHRRDGGPLHIEVRDDGAGGAADGNGTRSIIDRVEALGGHVSIESRPGLGTCVRAELPCGS